MKKVIFICSSNRDRSPALENRFREKYPANQYRSAGTNEYHCGKNGSHYLEQADLDWADLVVFVEEVIKEKALEKGFRLAGKGFLILACGEYDRDNPNEEYLVKAEQKLKKYL